MGFMRPRDANTTDSLTRVQGPQVDPPALRPRLALCLPSAAARPQAHTAGLQAFCPQLRPDEFARPALEALHLRQRYALARGEELLDIALSRTELADYQDPLPQSPTAPTGTSADPAQGQLSTYVQEFSRLLQDQRATHGRPYDTQGEIDLLRRSTLGLVQRYRTLGAQARPEHLHAALQQISRPGDQQAVTLASLGILRSYRPGDALQLQRLVDERCAQDLRKAQDQRAAQTLLAQHVAERKAALLPQVQRQAAREAGEADLAGRIHEMGGGGEPLPGALRRQLERRLQIAPEYLARVRVHTGSTAHALTKSIGALAATSGADIFFGQGQFDPNSRSGLELLGHEVTHVAQQLSGRVRGSGLDPDAGLEREAAEAGARLVASASDHAPVERQGVHRSPDGSHVAGSTTMQRQRDPNAPASSEKKLPTWHRDFAGTLAGKSVSVSLRRNGDKLHGRYQYARQEGWLTLEGTVRLEGGRKFVQLSERDENKQITGVFQGEFKGARGEHLLGQWTSTKSRRQFDFSFTLTTVHRAPAAPRAKPGSTEPERTEPDKPTPPTPKWTRLYGGILADSALRLDLKQDGGAVSGTFDLGTVGAGSCEGKQQGSELMFTATYTSGRFQGQTRSVTGQLDTTGKTLSGSWTDGKTAWKLAVQEGRAPESEDRKPVLPDNLQARVIAALPEAMARAPKTIRAQDAERHVPLILDACRDAGVTDPAQIAYILVTAGWETLMGMDGWMVERPMGLWRDETEVQYFEAKYGNTTRIGVNELGNSQPGDGYRYRGRGFVQLTGRVNYAKWTTRLKNDGFKIDGKVPDLVEQPELVATNKVLAAKILVEGMRDGTFTGKKLGSYVATNEKRQDFRGARRTVNGQDAAQALANSATHLVGQLNFEKEPDQTLDVQGLPRDKQRELVSRGMAAWGTEIGEVNGVKAFFNARDTSKKGRNYSTDGKAYDYGLKWQCVEFVRRYYYERLGHAFTSRGHAHSYFDWSLPDGAVNPERRLLQYRNGGTVRPETQDLIVFAPHSSNHMAGHVAIIINVSDTSVTVAQQNVDAAFSQTIPMARKIDGRWVFPAAPAPVLGWLRKE